MNLLAEAPPAFGLLIPVFFVPLWCCICAALSLTGGWHSLAKRFPAEQTSFRIPEFDDGKRFRFASMAMGSKFYPVSYGSCLTIEVNSNGIYIKIMPFFRLLHPPFLIPWSAIDDCVTKKYFLIWSRTAVYIQNRQD